MNDRVALVTGGSRGIGRAIALQLAADGHLVAVNYASNAGAAAEVVDAIVSGGGRAIAVGADVGDEAAVAAMFETVAAELGPVAVLVLSLIHISEPTRLWSGSRMPSSA